MSTSAITGEHQLPHWEVGNEPKFIADVAKLLKDNDVPCVLIGPAYHRILGIRGGIETISFAIDKEFLPKARQVLEAVGLSRECPDKDACCYSQASFCFRVPKPNDLFHVERIQGGTKHPVTGHISLYKREKWLPRLSSIPVCPPRPDNSDYILASDERLPFACEEHRRACRDNDKVIATMCVCGKEDEKYTGGRYSKSLPEVMILRPARLIETWVSAEFNEHLLEYHRDIEIGGDQGRFWDALYSFPEYTLWSHAAVAPELRLWWVMVRLTVGYVRGLSVPQLDSVGSPARDLPEEDFPRGFFPEAIFASGDSPDEDSSEEDSQEEEEAEQAATIADISSRRRKQLRLIRQEMLFELAASRRMHPIKGVSPV